MIFQQLLIRQIVILNLNGMQTIFFVIESCLINEILEALFSHIFDKAEPLVTHQYSIITSKAFIPWLLPRGLYNPVIRFYSYKVPFKV